MLPVLLLTAASTRPVALTYHDITLHKTVWFDCTPAEFRSQVDAMTRAGVHFVSLAQIEDFLLHGRPLPPRALALTFADNYRGFLTYAYPILKARKIPVAMFVHTGYVGSKIGRPKMTWDELRRLDREGVVTIGSQTVTHRDLTTLASGEVDRELRDSQAALTTQLGHPVRYLAYPDGAANASVERAVAASRLYRLAFGEVQSPILKNADVWKVDRYVHTKWRKALSDAGIRQR